MIYKIYFSATGRAKRVLDIISTSFEGEKTEVDLSCRNFNGNDYPIHSDDLCIFVTSVFEGKIPEIAEQNFQKLNGNHAKIILCAVFGNRSIDDCLLHMKDVSVSGSFIPVAGMQIVTQHSIFLDIEASRPDAKDIEQIHNFASQIKELLNTQERFPDLIIPGHRPYIKINPNMGKPIVNDQCIECGQCASHCPVNAIPENNYHVTNDPCIKCMRCIEICPVHARSLPQEDVERIYTFLTSKGLFAPNKPNVLYLAKD